jgi:DNA-binding beta-propeller fold protein YncE
MDSEVPGSRRITLESVRTVEAGCAENSGVLVVMKDRNSYFRLLLSLSTIFALAIAGCGGSSNTNVVTVSVSPSVATIIVSQSITLTSVVSGATNLNVTWACTYTTTTVDSTGKATTAKALPCTSDTGNIPASSANTTVTYTAPNKVPDPTKFPNLQVIITATSVQDTKKTGTATLTVDSGISVTLTPATATVPTGEQQNFSVSLTNDLQTQGVTFLITQGTPTTTIPYPSLTTCSPTCGTITTTGTTNTTATYTAPSTIPTTATLTIVAASKADTNRFSIGTITIIQGGPITFNNVSPTIAPQGASLYNIFLDAPFISSSSSIKLTGTISGNVININSGTGQMKILFPIPTTTVTNPPSTGARIQLTAANLHVADTYTVSVSDPAQTVTKPAGGGPYTVSIVPVRPTSVASVPDGIPQSGTANDLGLTIDGGYFGDGGSLVASSFNGIGLGQGTTSFSRQLNLILPSNDVNSALPGLYQLSVASRATPAPTPNNPSVTNLAVFPDYSAAAPSVVGSAVTGANPGAVDIDTRLGILAVAEPGANQVEFFSVGSGTLSSLSTQKVNTAAGTLGVPSGLSINQNNHTVAIVDFQNQGVFVVPLPGQTGDPKITYPLRISLAGLIPSTFTPAPLAYSIGVDPDTNNAVVAYSSTANPTTAKIGFLLDLNKDTQACLPSLTSATPPCIHAQVTLNTGQFPQIAMIPHSHRALVTPGGAGIIQGVDVTQASSSFTIANVSVSSGLATVTLNIPSGQALTLNPGNPGSVLIQNVPPGATHGTDFNGVFTIQSVPNSNSFTYALSAPQNDSVVPPQSPDTAFAFFGSPNISIAVSQTAQGIAINPITRTAALADANATGSNGPQIDLLNSLDQSISSITFHAGCTIYSSSCSGAPELLGTSSVAFQPYSNLLVSYNPQQNQVSISNPVNQSRYALVCKLASACQIDPVITSQVTLAGTGTACVTIPVGSTCTNGGQPPNELSLFGGLAVDPATNQAFVVQSGSSTIQIVDLGPAASTKLKPVEITELQVPTVSGAPLIGGIPGASMAQGTMTSSTDLGGVRIFGAGFDGTSQVRLDGTSIPSTFVSSREIDVTIPHTFLALPHRYAVDVRNSNGVSSGVTDFFVIMPVNMITATCALPQPSSVAIADQLAGSGQTFAPIAVVSNSGCGNVAVIDIAPQLPVYNNGVFTGFADNPNFGKFTSIPTGAGPQGVAVSPRFGMAVVANHTAGTASVLNLKTGKQQVTDVTVGASPTGVAIDEGTGTALIANTGDNTVSELNLALLTGSSPATSLTALAIAIDTSPIAVAIDPDRGTNNNGLAVVTALQLVSGSSPVGVLDAIDLGGQTPVKSTSAAVGSVTSTPTGIVFNPTVSPTLFYATSSGGNVVTTFNPDTGVGTSVRVGINPTSLAINPQTGGIVTVNSASQTISIIDTLSNPFKTRSTFGLGGSPQFGIAIDQFTNLAVLADQANNRVLIFPVPN